MVPKLNYWYVARPNELFLDIDNAERTLKHAKSRLQGAIECGKLDVAYAMQRPSTRPNHLHVIVTLAESMTPIQRYIWEIILHGDIYRGCCTAMRHLHSVPSADILISQWPCFNYQSENDDDRNLTYQQRDHDDFCNCKSKHNAATMETCPAAKRLRGDNRTRGFFGKPSKNPCTIWPEL